ncbi:hypothetical protein U91I_02780 [alpha proteobacterium U9-1i]|nr:hypothetical protein U91I_02780 [alpha proteobacterium U9-1i]
MNSKLPSRVKQVHKRLNIVVIAKRVRRIEQEWASWLNPE